MPAAPTALLSSLLLAGLAARQEPAPSEAARLFRVNCASCHGESGDGHGTAPLDRPARSFQDGGFSFGNTPEALFRTLSSGIPGTPMPSFESSLTEAQRRLLAEYVVTLGPAIEEVRDEDMVLAVRDRPLVVRGLLPALAEGLPVHPRGLLIGDPSGFSFEYRVDDVRLLALRQGGFVRRTDWTGRGGTALEPLGKVVHLLEGGRPEALFRLAADRPLEARLSATWSTGGGVALEYHLVEAGRERAHVTETPTIVSTPFGTGFTRRFALAESAPIEFLDARTGADALELEPARALVSFAPERPPILTFLRASDGGPPSSPGEVEKRLRWRTSPGTDRRSELAITTVFLTTWNDEVRVELGRWLEAER